VTGEEDLLAANGLMQIVQTAGFLIGPALAGFSIGLWGRKWRLWSIQPPSSFRRRALG